jgi:hypothetical protein
VSEQLRYALYAPGAATVLFCCVVAAVVLAVPLSRLLGRSAVGTLLGLLALAPILTFTMPPDVFVPAPGAFGRVRDYLGSFLDPFTVDAELGAAGSDAERLANLLLFVPAGFFWTLTARRWVAVAVGGLVVPFAIEGWQAVGGGRVASVGDWMHNSAGALLGVAAGAIVLLASRGATRIGAATVDPPGAQVSSAVPTRNELVPVEMTTRR